MNIMFDTDILTTMPVKRDKDPIKYSFYFHLAKFSASCRLKICFANIFLGGKADLLTIIQIKPKWIF